MPLDESLPNGAVTYGPSAIAIGCTDFDTLPFDLTHLCEVGSSTGRIVADTHADCVAVYAASSNINSLADRKTNAVHSDEVGVATGSWTDITTGSEHGTVINDGRCIRRLWPGNDC